MHAGLFAGGLSLWRSEGWRAEGHHEGQSKHGNESFHRGSSCYASPGRINDLAAALAQKVLPNVAIAAV